MNKKNLLKTIGILTLSSSCLLASSGFSVSFGVNFGTRQSQNTVDVSKYETGQAIPGYQTIDERTVQWSFLPEIGLNFTAAATDCFSVGASVYGMLDFLERTDLKERQFAGVAMSSESSDDIIAVNSCRSYLFGLVFTPGIMFKNGSLFKLRAGIECAKWSFSENVSNYDKNGNTGFISNNVGVNTSLSRV